MSVAVTKNEINKNFKLQILSDYIPIKAIFIADVYKVFISGVSLLLHFFASGYTLPFYSPPNISFSYSFSRDIHA